MISGTPPFFGSDHFGFEMSLIADSLSLLDQVVEPLVQTASKTHLLADCRVEEVLAPHLSLGSGAEEREKRVARERTFLHHQQGRPQVILRRVEQDASQHIRIGELGLVCQIARRSGHRRRHGVEEEPARAFDAGMSSDDALKGRVLRRGHLDGVARHRPPRYSWFSGFSRPRPGARRLSEP
jgi:hypothetical protein